MEMIDVLSRTYEKKDLNKYLKQYFKLIANRSSESIPFLVKVCERSPENYKLNNYIKEHKAVVIKNSSEDKYIELRQKSIIAKLIKQDLYEPYFIWKKFEEEFETKADSLHRLEAIKFFGLSPSGKEYQLEEIIGFLDLYPDAPWEVLDPLYGLALKLITSNEDLEIMLDLITGQLFHKENYRKLDYRALILYRLGQKERSLNMIQEVMILAKKENSSYKSMIYSLTKKQSPWERF